MTDKEIEEIEKRCNAAQRGPWMVGMTEHKQFLIITHIETGVRVSAQLLPKEIRQRLPEWNVQDDYGYINVCPEADIEIGIEETLNFVANSRIDVPKLISEIRRLKTETRS